MNMNVHEYVNELSEGNPGAINVMMMLLRYKGGDALDLYKALEKQKITGSVIWLLWKDVCKRDLERFVHAVNHPDCEDRKELELTKCIKKFVTKEICQVCEQELGIPGGYAGTGMCGPCCTGDASTLEEKFEEW